MSELKYLVVSDLLENIYTTLCSEYEDEGYYENKLDLQEISISKKRLASKILYEFQVDGGYLLLMNKESYEEKFSIFEDDFYEIIRNCAENSIPFETFTQLIDEQLLIANSRMTRKRKLKEVLQHSKEETIDQVEDPIVAEEVLV